MLYPVLRAANAWLNNDFDEFFENNWTPAAKATSPAINIKENDKQYEIELAVPGATKEDFHVNINEDNCLVIKMEHKEENKEENKGEHYLRREFSFANFQQALTLPDDVEHNLIKARVENGVLHVTLPRIAPQPKVQKSIEIA